MEQLRPARQSSGLYEGNFASDASLAGNAANPANTGAGQQAAATTPAAAPVPWYKTRKFIISQLIIVPLGIALLFILLFPVVTAIAQLVLKRSRLNIRAVEISNPQNGTFQVGIKGVVSHTGFIPARIEFTKPIQVEWVLNPAADDRQEIHIGHMAFNEPLRAHDKQAVIDQSTEFIIDDEAAFGRFSQHLITQPTFTWKLTSDSLRVQAAKFPVSKGLKFNQDVEIPGINSFDGNTRLVDFQLPSDNPDGSGINFFAVTELNNPSPFTLNLGTVVFDLSYDGLFLGTGTGKETILGPGSNKIGLRGTLVPQSGEQDTAKLSKLFTEYLNADPSTIVIATGRSTLQEDGTAISWLSDGLTALNLKVPFVAPNGEAISPIKTINIGNFDLQFSEANPWSPGVQSNSIRATMQLPFGFNVAISEIQNEFAISRNGQTVAGLSTPLGASSSDISVLSETNTEGTIDINIQNTSLSCDEPYHAAFSGFNADLTSSDAVPFQLVGKSRALARTSLGVLTLDPIKVNVTTELKGLQGLKGRTTIQSVDVVGGNTDGVLLGIQLSIDNPSNLKLATGDLTLQLFREGVALGTALLPNLVLNMGNNTVNSTSTFSANASPQGLQTLNDFVGKKDVQLQVAGYDSSTKVAPLLEAFKTLNIDVVLPGLKTNLVDTAALKILPTTGKENNIAHVSVKMVNPFSTSLQITRIQSTVAAYGIALGAIDSKVGFKAAPKADTTSPELELDMNFDPASLFTVTRRLAVEAGLDPAPLDGIVKLGGLSYVDASEPSQRSVKRQADLYRNFDLPKFVQTAFGKLKVDVQLKVDVTLGDYATTLEFSQEAVPTETDETLNLILPILAAPIVQKIVSGSILGIETVLISEPGQQSFNTELAGSIGSAGPFDATISFTKGLTVSWSGAPIGNIEMDDIKLAGDVGAAIASKSSFKVADIGHLTEFTKTLLTQETFDWDISGEALVVDALGIKVDGIALTSKRVSLKGFNGLKDGVKIKTFDLPSNDPAGGIHLTLEATTFNPSQVGIALSSLGFNTFVGDVMIAPVSASDVTLAPGAESTLSLVGRLVPQESNAGLSTVSDIFNNFVHGKDSNVVVQGANAGPKEVTWLNDGIRALQVATVLPNRGALDIIKSIDLNELTLLFTQGSAYSPLTSSSATDAAFTLPFGFPLDIAALEQTITTSFNGQAFAQLAIPKTPSKTDVDNRIIHLTFQDVPFAVFDGAHSIFNNFVAATTLEERQVLGLSGSADADADTAVGRLALKGIRFDVNSGIAGLQGLNARPVTVADLDVNRGFSDYLLLKLNSALFNPSNLTIGTGDVSFNLQFENQPLGNVIMNDLVIKPGNASYPTDVQFAPRGGAIAAGRKLLENFLEGIESQTSITGSTDSTPIGSLKSALSQISLSPVKIPALHDTLIKSASLSFPLDIVTTGIARTSFVLANPFTASINLLRVGAVAKYHDLTLGTIESVDTSSNPIHADGHSSVTSPQLPMKFNLDPVTIIRFLSIAAQERGVNLGPLVALFQFVLEHPTYHPPVTTNVDTKAPTCVSGNQFDVASAILNTLTDLHVDLAVDSGVKLDDFATDLAFNQKSIPATTDRTALFLIGAVAGPVAQALVDGSVLKFSSAIITGISDEGFDLDLKGSLTNVGPLDALIEFVDPINVNWQGHDIAELVLPPVCAAANTGVPNYETKARLRIKDQVQFTQFAIFLLHNEEFTWSISTSNLRLTALGTNFKGVSLKKDVTFKAFNNLPGVTISNFQLPSDDPAGGIHIETDAMIPSPAQLGIDLGTVTFEASYNGVVLGPLAAEHLTLAPSSTAKSHLSGRIVPQSGSNLETIGELFSNFLAGKNQTLVTRGRSVQPDGSDAPVKWLSDAFQTLELQVILPGEKFDVIQSITLGELEVTIETPEQAFAPPTSSSNTLATYKNPFGFSLQVIEAGQTITLSSAGLDLAHLTLERVPVEGGVSTGNVVDLHISWKDQILRAASPAAFAQMLAGVTNLAHLELNLRGTADVIAKTAIGNVLISGIAFNVPSELKGINAFGHVAALKDVVVAGSGGNGGNEYIVAPLKTTLNNPSNVTLHSVDVALPVYYNNVMIGRAAIDPFDLLPGSQDYDTEFHYQPADANDTIAQAFLTEFIATGNTIPLAIKGDAASTPFASLQPALSALQIGTSLSGLNHPDFITHVNVYITLDTLVTDLVSVDFDLRNPLDTPLTIEFVQSDAGVLGLTYARFGQAFESFTVPPGQTVNSGRFPDVLLTQGAIASLDIIPLGYLDIWSAVTLRVGENGYQIPWLKLQQNHVDTHYELELGLARMRAEAKKITESSSAVPSTTTSASASVSESQPSLTASRSENAVEPTATASRSEDTGEPTATAASTTASKSDESAAPASLADKDSPASVTIEAENATPTSS